MDNKVVSLTEIKPGIALICMEDKVNKNLFTEQFTKELCEAIEQAENSEKYKVVVLTGFDNYFISGGTKESLLNIYEKKITFITSNEERSLYSLPLDCKLPVIAAMQGHAIGGGLSLGLFADHIIMSRESIYTASFMKYGFTPGFGSTYIFEKKLGIVLAQEMLIAAKTYRGEELQRRGVPFEVYPRKDVLEKAIGLAELIAEKPRVSLILLKEAMTREMKKRLPDSIKEELEMHNITFSQKEVKAKILEFYTE